MHAQEETQMLKIRQNSEISDKVAHEYENESAKEEGAEIESRKWVTVRCEAYGRWRLR